MLGRSRYHVAPLDPRASRATTPGTGLGRLARRVSQMLVGAIIMSGTVSAGLAARPALAAAQPPIGYERWTNPDASSGVDFGLTTKQVFQKYAASFAFGGIPQTEPQKDKRLIDIEVHPDRSGLANYVYDVVWVRDEGEFALESWFVPGLTEDELHLLPQLAPQGIAALDVERYPKGNEWRYAVILQRNAGEFGWDVLTDASLDQVLETAGRDGLRLLDLDYAAPGPLSCPTVQGQACAEATFDAILVANSGSNAIETKLWFDLTPAQIVAKEDQGYQMIDREDGVDNVATLWVKSGLPFELADHLSENEVTFEHGHHGRVVDLEKTGTSYAIVRFAGSAAPASPELADLQQGDTNDGKHKTKSHKGGKHKAKSHKGGKHKAKHRGGGKKRGKGKHRR